MVETRPRSQDLYRCKVEELAHRGFTMKLGIFVGFRPKPTDYLFGSCRGISRDSRAKNCMVIFIETNIAPENGGLEY